MRTINEVADTIISESDDNTAGLVMSKENIIRTIRKCIYTTLSDGEVNEIMGDFESDAGYLVKARDIIYELTKDDICDGGQCMEANKCPYFQEKGEEECKDCDL